MIRGSSRSLAAGEVEPDPVRIRDLDRLDLAEARAVERLAVLLQQLEGEPHVLGGQRMPVREARPRVEVERDGAAVLRHLDGAGDKAVEGERLVQGAHHQALQHVAGHGVRRDAEHDQRIEAVEACPGAPG